MIFIAKQLTADGWGGAWNMCGEINTDTEFSCRSLKEIDHLVPLVVNVNLSL